jgi:catechol 2,3-dioxygenase-like lactoylglutathione lyase family enzyme
MANFAYQGVCKMCFFTYDCSRVKYKRLRQEILYIDTSQTPGPLVATGRQTKLKDIFYKDIFMGQRLASVTLVVKDYDEAISFFIEKLSFELIEDTKLTDQKRWVLVSPPGDNNCYILLAKAADERQVASIGNQTGGRVAFFLHTDNFWHDFEILSKNKIHFVRQPQEQEYGIVAVFEDLYGNLWDLVQRKVDTNK